MTTKYRLPDSLGGHEIVNGTVVAEDDGRVTATVLIDGRKCDVTLAPSLIVEVKPPLPPEFPVGSLAATGLGPERSNPLPIYRRWDEGWFRVGEERPVVPAEWAEVCEVARRNGGTPVLLVPDPFGEPVKLPWLWDVADGKRWSVSAAVEAEWVRLASPGSDVLGFSPDEARDMARALWAAADKAEHRNHSSEGA